MTRTVAAHLFSSLNGVSESPHLFQFDAFGQQEGELMGRSLDGATDVIMGRQLWQEWSEYWPANPGDGFDEFINPIRKHVLSATLGTDGAADADGELGWNSHLITGDPMIYLNELKESDGGKILVTGGVDTVRGLFLAGYIDTLTLTIHPVVTNEGRRLFDDSVPTTRLTLVDHTITDVGNAVLTYRLRRD